MTMPFQTSPSPNHGDRTGERIDMLILHYTGMPCAEAALARLCDAEARVSAHWFVHEDGRIVSLVAEARRAWHAGIGHWADTADVNSSSVGIEIQNPGHEHGYRPFPEPQMAAVAALARDIVDRYAIPARRVLGHSDVAPARKQDPGELFPWRRLAEEGVGLWVEPTPPGGELDAAGRAELCEALRAFGYVFETVGGEAPATVVTAFQRHWRPGRVDGQPDVSTLGTLRRLLAAAED